MVKPCERCGKDFEVTPNNFNRTKYCADCRKIVQREQLKQYRRRKRQQAPPVICQRCGKIIVGKRGNCKWCDRCRPIVEREQDRQSKDRLKRVRLRVQSKPAIQYEFTPRQKTFTCRFCGQEFTTARPHQLTCPDCLDKQRQEKLRRQQELAEKERLAKMKVDKATGKPVKTLGDWAREAAEKQCGIMN